MSWCWTQSRTQSEYCKKKNFFATGTLIALEPHNFAQLVFLKAYNSIHKFDIICLSETYIDSNILPNYSNLEIPGYDLVRSDHLSNKKRGSVCVYYKSYLPLRNIDINVWMCEVWANGRSQTLQFHCII